jgi:hypothetical protein
MNKIDKWLAHICAKEIVSGEINADGELVFTTCDGSTLSVGKVTTEDSNDGFSPTVEIIAIEGGTRIIITDVNGPQSVDIMDGISPRKGIDYFTEADKAEIAQQAAELVDSVEAVLYTPQTLTDDQKAQARENIGAGNGLTLKAIALLIKILQHATYTEDMSSQIELLAEELMGGGGNTDGGSLIVTDDGDGNVTITASGSASITDDGEGNVTITASGDFNITDDGDGNVIIA